MAAMSADWEIAPGERLTRAQRIALFGGAKFGGIQPSRTTLNVFVYSDPSRGGVIYPYDGWAESNSVFLYTGEGQRGDQLMTGGNSALRDHEQSGRAVRLFVADGMVEGTTEKIHIYVGQFRVDPNDQYRIAPAPDADGEERTVLVFRLLPIGAAHIRDEDVSGTGEAPSIGSAVLVPPEEHNAPNYDTPGSGPATATRRESELVARYREFLVEQGHAIKRWSLRPAGELLPLLTDLYDETTKELYEAKGTAVRNSVRLAIGQLLDYRRHIDVPELKLSLLLPTRPSDDLLKLIESVEMGCVYEVTAGEYERIEQGHEG
jgi:5-methylcytosine-specific restriction protein A